MYLTPGVQSWTAEYCVKGWAFVTYQLIITTGAFSLVLYRLFSGLDSKAHVFIEGPLFHLCRVKTASKSSYSSYWNGVRENTIVIIYVSLLGLKLLFFPMSVICKNIRDLRANSSLSHANFHKNVSISKSTNIFAKMRLNFLLSFKYVLKLF